MLLKLLVARSYWCRPKEKEVPKAKGISEQGLLRPCTPLYAVLDIIMSSYHSSYISRGLTLYDDYDKLKPFGFLIHGRACAWVYYNY